MKKPLMIAGGAVAVAVLALVALVVIQLLRSDDPDLATEAPQIATATPGSSGADGSEPTATAASEGGDVVDLPEGVRRFVIDPSQSSAKYVVEETLRGLITNAVGTTSEISGEIYLTEEGLWDGAESTFQVDLSTLQSDEGMRDRYIRDNTLQTSQFPNAVFVIESIDGFPAAYTEGEQVELSLSGKMTIHGTEQPMTFTVLARQAGSTLTATADADFNMTDFGITPPNVQIAQAKDGVHIQVVLVAEEPA